MTSPPDPADTLRRMIAEAEGIHRQWGTTNTLIGLLHVERLEGRLSGLREALNAIRPTPPGSE